jgi:hypothetical protein
MLHLRPLARVCWLPQAHYPVFVLANFSFHIFLRSGCVIKCRIFIVIAPFFMNALLRYGCLCFLARPPIYTVRVQVVDNSPGPELISPPPFEPQYCARGTPGLSLNFSFGMYLNSKSLIVSLVPIVAVSDTLVFIITLAGAGLTFSTNKKLTFVSPPEIAGSAYLNLSSLVLNVAMNPSWNFSQHQPIIFAFGDLESVQSMAKYDVQSAAFSSNGTCLLQSSTGFSPQFSLFPENLTKRGILQCRSAHIDDNGFC